MSEDKKITPKLMVIAVDLLHPNPWNPNKMNAETYEKEKRSIETNGFIDPVTIREVKVDKGRLKYEIVDGEHRWKAAGDLGIKEVPCVNLGEISDAQAKKLTIITNELRGSPEPARLAALLKDLNSTIEVSDLALHLPMSSAEIDSLIKSADTFDWADRAETLDIPDDAIGKPHKDGGAVEMAKLVIGTVKGEMPPSVSQALQAEFDRSARACGSKTPEVVMNHWLARLAKTAEETDAEAAARPKVEPKPKKKAKAKKKDADETTEEGA